MSKSALQEVLERIKAKLELGMKLTDYEMSLYVLYRDEKEQKNGTE